MDNRIIDLSQAAAREIESIGPGVVHVRLEVLGNVDPTAGYFTIQVGAFRERANAERLKARLSAEYSPIFIQQYDTTDGAAFYRVRVGKISGEDAARQLGEQLHNKEGFSKYDLATSPLDLLREKVTDNPSAGDSVILFVACIGMAELPGSRHR